METITYSLQGWTKYGMATLNKEGYKTLAGVKRAFTYYKDKTNYKYIALTIRREIECGYCHTSCPIEQWQSVAWVRQKEASKQ